MALNMDKMKNKMASLESRGNRDLFWKPSDGEQTIRIAPDPDGDPFKEYWFHYNLGENQAFLSPKKNFGDDCPLDTFVRKLFDERTDDSRELAKKLMAKQRFFSPVIVRGEEEKGVRLWGYSKTVYQKLLNLVLNPEYGDITDVDKGTDLTLKYGKAPGAMFPSTDIFPSRRTSALAGDEELVKEFVATTIDYDKLFQRRTTEEVQIMLDTYMNAEGSTEVSEKPSSVDAAFKDLLS